MTLNELEKALQDYWKLEDQEDAGCPFFYSERCKIQIDDAVFNAYCLDKYKDCKEYQRLVG